MLRLFIWGGGYNKGLCITVDGCRCGMGKKFLFDRFSRSVWRKGALLARIFTELCNNRIAEANDGSPEL